MLYIRVSVIGGHAHAVGIPGSLDMWGSTMGYIKAVGSHLSSRRRPWQATKDPAEQLATLMLLVPQSKGAVWPKDAKG